MSRDTSLDIIRFATLMKEGRCNEDDIRSLIFSRRVKPLYHVDELDTAFMKWSDDGSRSYHPIEDSDDPYELFNGYVYLEINRVLGFLDCDFQRFTKTSDVNAGLFPLPQYSLVEHVSMEDVLRNGGLTNADAELLERPPPRTDAKPHNASLTPIVAESASAGNEPWKEKARACAYEIIKRDGAKDLYPSQVAIADEIARQFRRAGVKGTDGKPLTGAYIKRWALTGISSAQSKLVSTVIRQGK